MTPSAALVNISQVRDRAVPFVYRADLEGLRGVVLWPVVFFHAGVHSVPGALVSVDVFFVLSGYLITQIALGDMIGDRFDYAQFWDRRVRRILPALFAAMTFVLICGGLLFSGDSLRQNYLGVAAASLFSENFLVFQQISGFAYHPYHLPLQHAWTLSIEEQFYLLYPIFLGFTIRRGWQFAVTLLAVIAILSIAFSLMDSQAISVYFLSPSRAWELLLGALLALNILPPVSNRVVREALAVCAVLIYTISVAKLRLFSGHQAIHIMPACFATAILIHVNRDEQTLIGRALSTQPWVIFGKMSYSIYVWHWPIMVFALMLTPRPWSHMQILLVCLAAAAASAASWKYLEQPFRKRDGVFKRPALFATAGALTMLFAAVGLIGYVN